MANNAKLTPEAAERFLAELRSSGNVSKAARLIPMARGYMYEYREKAENADFKRAWIEAKAEHVDDLEEECARRAKGWDEERRDKDGNAYSVRKYSDLLLIFRLKAERPEKYRDPVHAHAPIEASKNSDLDGDTVNRALRSMAIAKSDKVN